MDSRTQTLQDWTQIKPISKKPPKDWTKGHGLVPCGTRAREKEREEVKAKDGPKDRARSAGLWTIGPRSAHIIKEARTKEAKARTEEVKERARAKQGQLGTRTMDSEDSRVIATCVA